MQFTIATLIASVLAFSGVLTSAASVPVEKRSCRGDDAWCGVSSPVLPADVVACLECLDTEFLTEDSA
jgi:hypothetical protein